MACEITLTPSTPGLMVKGSKSLFGNSVAFDQMSAAGWKLVWLGPEVGDQGDLAVFVELEEAQAGLRALLPGERDPAGRDRGPVRH